MRNERRECEHLKAADWEAAGFWGPLSSRQTNLERIRKKGINFSLGAFLLRPSTPSLGWCLRSEWWTKITEKKSLWFLEDYSTTFPEYLSVCCIIIKKFSPMFHLSYISTTFKNLFVGKGSHSSIPTPPQIPSQTRRSRNYKATFNTLG